MTAGFTHTVRVWRYTNIVGSDDAIGGSRPTGTVIYESVQARIMLEKPTMALMDQGLETGKIFTFSLMGMAKDTRENDVLECTSPNNSFYFGDKFRIIGEPRPSVSPTDPRYYLLANARRYEEAHGNEQP